jgi:hypothetical protein
MLVQTSALGAAADGLRIIDVDRMELVIVDRARPPQSGTFIRTIDAHTLSATSKP